MSGGGKLHHLMLEETGNKPYEATQQCDLLLTGQVVHCCVQACPIKSEIFLQPLCQVGDWDSDAKLHHALLEPAKVYKANR